MNYADLRTPKAKMSLSRYLCNRFGLIYEAREDMLRGVSEKKLSELSERLEGTKTGEHAEERARNDATLALAVYAKRRRNNELGSGNPYGYTSWWLTKEFRIRAETADLVRRAGARFLMVPEFLLNFIAVAPTAADVRNTFEQVFPTRLGIQLSNRMREDVFRDVMRKLNEAGAVDPDRLLVKMADLSDQLEGDRFKQYERKIQANR